MRGPLDVIKNCHCYRDRKMTGAPHDSCLLASASALQWLRGETLLVVYSLPEAPGFRTGFCRVCGTSLRPSCHTPSRSVSRLVHSTTIREPVPGITSSVGSRRRRPGLRLPTTCRSLPGTRHRGSIGGTLMPWGKGRECYEARPKEAKPQSGSRAGPNQGVQATANSLRSASAIGGA